MNPFDANGWTILFYTDFQLQWEDLTARVVKLKSKLDPKDFVTHPDVKLLKALDSGIRDKISVDPFASHFSLRKPLGITMPKRKNCTLRHFQVLETTIYR